mmetsp:Transcript_3103/g.7905  ORF Transcript_3103/g.7905 Transcript_3103/m.7905 type:complete len:181 (+) Transcript_3103:49-591(+)
MVVTLSGAEESAIACAGRSCGDPLGPHGFSTSFLDPLHASEQHASPEVHHHGTGDVPNVLVEEVSPSSGHGHADFLAGPGHTSSAASSFLSMPQPLSAEQLVRRQTQLRVALGISSTTFLTSMGLMGSCVLRLARKHMAEEDAAEAAALDAGRANAKEPQKLRLTIHDRDVKRLAALASS